MQMYHCDEDAVAYGLTMRDYVDACHARLVRARRCAENVRHSDKLHRIAMKTVFLLEDCHETLVRLAGEPEVWRADAGDVTRTTGLLDRDS